ncbi:MAG: sodium:solute symporter family protein [Myxococcota bacterium]
MSFGALGLVALGGYLVLLLGIAELARRSRREHSAADHFLAGRELGVLVLFLTLYATGYSGNSLLGYPGEAYRRGFSWIMATGFMMSIAVVFQVFAPKFRPIAAREHFVSPGDWVRYRFGGERWGRELRIAVAVLMTIALANFLFAQLKALGLMAEQVTEGLVSYEVGVCVLAGVILAYETVGGMRAVAWTDAGQSILMMVGLTALVVWLVGDVGGLEALTRSILEIRPAAAVVPDAVECANWASSIALLGLASAVYPQVIQRVYAARSGAALKRSFALMTFMPLTTTTVVTLIGVAAIPRFAELGGVEADRVMPLLLGGWAELGALASVAAILVFLGALAAIMSTADSVLLSLGSVVAEDLLGEQHGARDTAVLGKRIAAVTMVAMAALALVARDVTLWGLIELKMELLIQCVPAFLIGVQWTRLRGGPLLLGLLVGSAIAVGIGLGLGVKRIGGVHVGVIGLGVNAVIACAGSWWARDERAAT